MDKEEILTRSRNAKQDEGLEYALNKGRVITISTVLAVAIILGFYSWIFVNPNKAWMAIFGLVCLFSVCETLSLYRFTKKRRYLIALVLETLLSASFIVQYVYSTWGWWIE